MSWDSAGEALASIDAQVRGAQERADAAVRLNERLGVLRSVGRSRTGVEVEVDASGRLTGIEFTPGALTVGPDKLARAVMEAVGEAATVSAKNVGFLATEAFGEDSDLAERIHGEALSRIPATGSKRSEGGVAW